MAGLLSSRNPIGALLLGASFAGACAESGDGQLPYGSAGSSASDAGGGQSGAGAGGDSGAAGAAGGGGGGAAAAGGAAATGGGGGQAGAGQAGEGGGAGEAGSAGVAGAPGGAAGAGGSGGAGGAAGAAGAGGVAGSAGVAATGGSGGAPQSCSTAAECPPTGSECVVATCVGSLCGTQNVPAGKTAVQDVGDCKERRCDGAGAELTVNDDSDVPDDSNPCTDDVCTAGSPSNPAEPNGTACGASLTCLNGACSGCAAPADCPGTDDECKTRRCTTGSCGFDYQPSGTLVSAQAAQDCKKNVCDGAGNVTVAADPSDPPASDSNACTDDTCIGTTPTHAPLTGTPCSDANACTLSDGCQNGSCIGSNPVICTALDQCHLAGTCDTGTGVCSNPAKTDGSGCSDGDACTQSDTCQAGSCTGASPVVCTPLDQCHVAGTCDPGSGACSNPNAPDFTPCAGGGACVSGACELPPTVVSTTPADAATGVVVTTTIAVTFSTAMDATTLVAQTAPGACSGSVRVSTDGFATCLGFATAAPAMSGGDTVATWTAAPGLAYGSTFQVRVTTAAESAVGIAMQASYTSATGFTTGTAPSLCDGAVVVSQVYGGGGNVGAQWENDFIELHNRGEVPVSLAGWSVQYASSGGSTWSVTALSGSIAAGGYYLVQQASGGTAGAALPAPDATGNISMSSTSGKVALVKASTALSGTCPTSASIADLVGYGTTASCYEGSGATPTLGSTTAALRNGAGCTDTDDNAADFTELMPAPRNSASAPAPCNCGFATMNEKSIGGEVDYCNLQFPIDFTVQASQTTPEVYGRIYEQGLTEAGGAPPGVQAELGYGPIGANPEHEPGWTWVVATYNVQSGNDDEFKASFTAPAAPGTYFYTYRFSFDGVQWTYCDVGGAGSNTSPDLFFETTRLATMTVTP